MRTCVKNKTTIYIFTYTHAYTHTYVCTYGSACAYTLVGSCVHTLPRCVPKGAVTSSRKDSNRALGLFPIDSPPVLAQRGSNGHQTQRVYLFESLGGGGAQPPSEHIVTVHVFTSSPTCTVYAHADTYVSMIVCVLVLCCARRGGMLLN